MSLVDRVEARAACAKDGLMVKMGRFLDEARLGDLIRKKGDLVGIKIDVGELGCLSALRPPVVRAVVEKVLELGGDPVPMDTNRLNSSPRSVGLGWMEAATVNGYTNATLGRAVILADGYTGEEGELLPIDGDELGGVEVARVVTEYASLIVVSHVTGHPLAGLSGALLNFGVGCSALRGKLRIHSPVKPLVDEAKCDGCGLCAAGCVRQAISVCAGTAKVDRDLCRGCVYYCMAACPRAALMVDSESAVRFQKAAVEAASAVHVAAQGRVHFINVLLDTVPYPDYYPFSDVPMVPDLGVLSSRDPVAIDQATLELIDAMAGVPGSAAEDHHVLAPGTGKLSAITGVDPAPMLDYACNYGLGSRQCELRTL